jgi:hypothetical protein
MLFLLRFLSYLHGVQCTLRQPRASGAFAAVCGGIVFAIFSMCLLYWKFLNSVAWQGVVASLTSTFFSFIFAFLFLLTTPCAAIANNYILNQKIAHHDSVKNVEKLAVNEEKTALLLDEEEKRKASLHDGDFGEPTVPRYAVVGLTFLCVLFIVASIVADQVAIFGGYKNSHRVINNYKPSFSNAGETILSIYVMLVDSFQDVVVNVGMNRMCISRTSMRKVKVVFFFFSILFICFWRNDIEGENQFGYGAIGGDSRGPPIAFCAARGGCGALRGARV